MRTTENLIDAAKNGDSGAFTELVRRYERAAWIVAWKVLRDHHTALDATQIAFVEAYRKLSQLRSPSQFGVWLMQIAHREALRIVRRPRNETSLNLAIDVPAPEPYEPTVDSDEMMTAVANLPEHERLVVVLRFFHGNSIEQVAQFTGRPVGTVTKQLSRAVARLRTLLGSPVNEPQ